MANLSNLTAPAMRDLSAQNVIVTVYAALFVIGVSANLFVIFLILKCLKLKNISNVYIFNLALADILYLVWLPVIIMTIRLGQWPWGQVLCKLHYFSTGVNRYGSSLFLTVLCIDRFMAVCFPICSRSYRNLRWALITVCICWILVGLLMIPVIFAAGVRPTGPTTYSCSMQQGNVVMGNFSSYDNYTLEDDGSPFTGELMDLKTFTIYSVAVGVTFLLIMWGLYSMVLWSLWGRKQMSRSSTRQKSTRKVTRTVLAILIFYTICWAPLWIHSVLVEFYAEIFRDHLNILIGYSQVVFALNYVNSAFNPVLYTLMSDTYRTLITENCLCKRKKRGPVEQKGNSRAGRPMEEMPLKEIEEEK